MKTELNYKIICPDHFNEDLFWNQSVLTPFHEYTINFIKDIANKILDDDSFREFPELLAVAFWMRASHVHHLKKSYEDKIQKNKNSCFVARGVTFHIPPTNVDTIFIYSWFISMLMGNLNIVRIPPKNNIQFTKLLEVIKEISILPEHEEISKRFMLVSYGYEDEITSYFSKKCDVRVIWGGDSTVDKIKSIPIPPTSIDLAFANKFSYCFINAKSFLDQTSYSNLITNFYNDAFWFDQKACSSPKLIVWVGEKNDCLKAREIFWKELEVFLENKNEEIPPALAMDKLVAEYSMMLEKIKIKERNNFNNIVNRILVNDINDVIRNKNCGGGLFYEIIVSNLNEISQYFTRKDQTVSVFGFNKDELLQFIVKNNIRGIDRFVPIGKALEFSIKWDGYDLFSSFTREIEIYNIPEVKS